MAVGATTADAWPTRRAAHARLGAIPQAMIGSVPDGCPSLCGAKRTAGVAGGRSKPQKNGTSDMTTRTEPCTAARNISSATFQRPVELLTGLADRVLLAVCTEPGCPALVSAGRCSDHARQGEVDVALSTHPDLVRLERARRAMAQRIGYQRSDITVVMGPPCSGKTTYVRQNARPGDIIVDFDSLAFAMGSGVEHDHEQSYIIYACAARDAIVERLFRPPPARAWVILTSEDQAQRLGLHEAEWKVLDTPLEVCRERAVRAGRSADTMAAIEGWGRSPNR